MNLRDTIATVAGAAVAWVAWAKTVATIRRLGSAQVGPPPLHDLPEHESPSAPQNQPPRATWQTYQKEHATWAVKLPVDVVIPTREGEVEGKGGDYLCIDQDGGLYPCDAETFEKMYEPYEPGEGER